MIVPTTRLATLMLAGLIASCAFALHAQDSATAAAEQDAKDVMNRAANPPDLSKDGMPEGMQQGSNAGSINTHTETSGESSSHSSGHSSGGSIGFGIGGGRVPGQISNNPPPPPGWPGHDAGVRQAQMQGQAQGTVARVDAGPIWNNDDARNKCTNACSRINMGWNGDWRTTGSNQSECDCVAGGNRPDVPHASGPGTSCSAPANHQCSGCSISCPPGDKTAHCTQGERGIFTRDDETLCPTKAECVCR